MDGSQDQYIPSGFVRLTDAEVDALLAAPLPSAPVPTVVTMRQARLALLAAGQLAAVGAAIAALPSPDKEAAEIEWDYSSTVKRGTPLVNAIAAALGLNEPALDALFTAASLL